MIWARGWLLIATAACASAQAQPPTPPQKPASAAQPTNAPPGDAPDDEFIEFLGSDDVGDAAWWQFLKRAPPRVSDPAAPSSQDARQ